MHLIITLNEQFRSSNNIDMSTNRSELKLQQYIKNVLQKLRNDLLKLQWVKLFNYKLDLISFDIACHQQYLIIDGFL